jgi:hypothetical protein
LYTLLDGACEGERLFGLREDSLRFSRAAAPLVDRTLPLRLPLGEPFRFCRALTPFFDLIFIEDARALPSVRICIFSRTCFLKFSQCQHFFVFRFSLLRVLIFIDGLLSPRVGCP